MSVARKDSKGRALRKGETYRSKEARYAFEYRDAFGRRKTIYSKDLLTLREREKSIMRDEIDGINLYVAGKATLNHSFERYMQTKYNLKENTRSNYIYMYNKYVRDTFGKRLIASIKYSDVIYFYQQLLTESNLQLNTVDSIHTIINPVFTMAVRDEIIRTNPASGVIADISKKAGKNKGIRHALTRQQQRAFVDFTASNELFNHWWSIYTVLLGTGMRVGEFVGLRWEDIDFDKRTISVNHGVVYYKKRGVKNEKCEYLVSKPKTQAGIRIIPMIDEVYKALQFEYDRQIEQGFCRDEIQGMTGFIFSNRFGKIYNQQSLNRGIQRIRDTYNNQELLLAAKEKREPLLLPHFSCHHLRHTFATRLCETETNLKVIQSIMGHANIETTMDIYAEATEEKKEDTMKLLSKKYNSMF